MPIDPLRIASEVEARFRRYLETTFSFPDGRDGLRRQFREALAEPGRLFRGPYLHGLAPYVTGESVRDLVARGVLSPAAEGLPLLPLSQPLYRHQIRAIERLRAGRNVVVSSGTGSGKTLSFLAPVLNGILEKPAPGIHALLLYPMNALVNDQLKNLRRVLRNVPKVRFGRYVNIEVTPESESQGRQRNRDAPANEVVSRDRFRAEPPHILVTNYAMLEYLLLRVDDSPLFQGPWRYIVMDEAHTYGGTKGGEVALLLRRLVERVKRAGDPPPQYIATSATLGTDEPARRAEVLGFARTLFNAPFEGDDLIVAERDHAPAEGGTVPAPGLYVHPALEAACVPGAKWTAALSSALTAAGFPAAAVAAAAALPGLEEALYHVFRSDARVLRLRAAAAAPRDLAAAARIAFGRDDADAIQQLCGLVRVCSLARVPGGDARLVPCRYHLFVRGLTGAFVSLTPADGVAVPALTLKPAGETADGRKVLELYACRKCGQSYLRGTASEGALVSGKAEGAAVWATWAPLGRGSDDEVDEVADGVEDGAQVHHFHTLTGGYRKAADGPPAEGEVRLWQIHDEKEMGRCAACGGQGAVTPVRADAEAAQAVIADAYYRCLPEAAGGPPPAAALGYPGRGRKLLAFSDNRQSAAYFAPYLENANRELLDRALLCQAVELAAAATGGEADADSVVRRMHRLAEDEGLYPPDMARGQALARCARAAVAEFCVPFGRRQSLEALALVACGVALRRTWAPPPPLLEVLSPTEAEDLAQVLLGSLRMVKAVAMPEQVSATDPVFRYQAGHQAVVAQGSLRAAGQLSLHGFSPSGPPLRQRRSAYVHRVLQNAGHAADAVGLLDDIWKSLTSGAAPALKLVTVGGNSGHQIKWERLWFRPGGAWYVCSNCRQWSAFSVRGVCPSFRCDGRLERADPDGLLAGHHYRRIVGAPAERPVPVVAREHTAQLGPQLAADYQAAFQDGHHDAVGQINVLSSSTTFELGVDLGDLEAVFLRNVPPTPANYQQRAGRAGRGVGSAAFAVTFAMPRSHDETFFADPPRMIGGVVRPPRAELRNETIYLRHLSAVLLAEFVRHLAAAGRPIKTIGGLIPETAGVIPLDEFLQGLSAAVARNDRAVASIVPPDRRAGVPELAAKIADAFRAARTHYLDEVDMYADAVSGLRLAEQDARAATPKRPAPSRPWPTSWNTAWANFATKTG